jgi:outer membrane lipoprotein-sorting protein
MLVRQDNHSEELLNRAIAATRQLPMPTGPSAEVAAQTLAAVREAAEQPETTLLQRIRHMPWTSKAFAILATAASLLVVYVGLSTFTSPALAFADVVEVLNKVRSATWKSTSQVKMPNSGTVTMSGTGMFLSPSHERIETTALGVKTIQIMDGTKDKIVTLTPATKMAMIINVKNQPTVSPYGKAFETWRQLAELAKGGLAENVERLEAQTIDGRRAEGFRMRTGSIDAKIWADPKTRLPLRVQFSTTEGAEVQTIMTDFEIDVDLDPALFSLEVPPEYTLQRTEIDLAKKPLEYLADALKMVAEINDGVFPAELRGNDGIDGIMQRSALKWMKLERTVDGKMIMSSDAPVKLGGAFGFVLSLSRENNDWHYAGKGVKLNTPDRPIFWYRDHKLTRTYHVLYADLSIKEVPAEEAPKVPQSEGSPKP